MRIMKRRSLPPASSRRTLYFPDFVRRSASRQPAVPAPAIMKSNANELAPLRNLHLQHVTSTKSSHSNKTPMPHFLGTAQRGYSDWSCLLWMTAERPQRPKWERMSARKLWAVYGRLSVG